MGITIPRWSTATDDRDSPPFDARNVPHGKQEWYVNVGGIWQDVTLTAVSKIYIDHLKITPDIHTGRVNVEIRLAGNVGHADGYQLTLRTADSDSAISLPLMDGKENYQVTLHVDHLHLWNVDDPYLYTLITSLNNDDDEVS